jgi:hypothetical protein
MNKFKCKKCGKLSMRTGRYKGYTCYSCKFKPPKPPEKRKIINFNQIEYPPIPNHFKIDSGCNCGSCSEAMFIIINNNNDTAKDISNVSRTSWLNSLVKKTVNQDAQKTYHTFIFTYLVLGLDIVNERILTLLLKSCYSFPVVIRGILYDFDLDETANPNWPFEFIPWNPGYYEAYFTNRYPTLEEYMKIKSEYPGFDFGKPSKMCFHDD